MKITNVEKGGTTKYYFIDIELENGKEAEVSLVETYHVYPEFSKIDISVINKSDFTAKEIKEIEEYIEKKDIEELINEN